MTHALLYPFEPPNAAVCAWHLVDTHTGRRRLQWRPGVRVWHAEKHEERWTAERASELGWRHVAIAVDQTEGMP